tara:strand:+ start:398 stop:574 length:177 start_codon:yes stop_codon:yes gene_type:complete
MEITLVELVELAVVELGVKIKEDLLTQGRMVQQTPEVVVVELVVAVHMLMDKVVQDSL